jgi:hypothetical protein
MTSSSKVKALVFILFVTVFNFGCKNQNHIDKYDVNLELLKTLPNAFYAYRRGNIYYEDGKLKEYRIWFNLDNFGNVKNIFKIEDFADNNANEIATIRKYKIDTAEKKILMQRFINLSRKFKFGHINVDKSNKISFSYQDGLREQYVKTLNDSLSNIYLKNKDFRLLNNGWFEYVEK